MIKIRATLFETLHLCDADGRQVELSSPTLRSLAAYLILRRQRPLDRRKLAFSFWPDAPESAARRNLRQYIHHLRQALQPLAPEGELLAAEGSTIQIAPTAEFWVDIEAFEQSLHPGATLEEVENALQLYTGDLLADLYDEWCIPEREKLRDLYLKNIDHFTRSLQTSARYEQALVWARRWMQAEPLDENAQRRVITLLALLGDRPRAIQQYQTFAQTLREKLDAEPLPETQELLRSIQTGELLAHTEPAAAPPATSRVRPKSEPGHPQSLPLIGRKNELRLMEDLLERVHKGSSQTLIITGEAGIGKTRLIQEYFQHHPSVAVIHSVCYELDSFTSYAPLRNSLRDHPLLRDLLAQARSQPPSWLLPLRPLLPGVETILPFEIERAGEAASLREAWVQLLIHIARRSDQPLHLIIDDLHWADTPTWELLIALGRAAGAEPLVVIGLCRQEDLPTDRLPLLHSIERSGTFLSMTLPRLSFEETGALARHIDSQRGADELFLKRLHQETGGNPFFVIETVRAMREAGPELRALPPSIQRVIEARLERLSPTGQEILSMAAAIGRSFNSGLLGRIANKGSDELIPLIEEWEQRGLVYESEAGYDFRHDQFRQVAYARLSRARREYTHRQIADALSDSFPPTDDATLAYHYAHSDQPLKALPHLAQAGEQALRLRSYHEARQFGQQAISLLGQTPGLGQRAERVDINLQLAQAYAYTGDIQHAIEILNETEGLAFALGDEARLSQVFRRAAQFFWLRGQPQPASDYAHRALRGAEERKDGELLFASLRMLGRISIALAAFDDAIAHLTRYINLAEDERSLRRPPEDLPIVLGYLGIAYARVGAWEHAYQAARRGLALSASRVDDMAGSSETFVRMQLGMVQAASGSWQDCLDTLNPLRVRMEPEMLTPPLYMALGLYGLAQSHLGKTKDGIASVQMACDWAAKNNYRVFEYLPRLFLAECFLLDGQTNQAFKEGERALVDARQAGDRWSTGVGLRLLADIRSRMAEPTWVEIENLLIDSMRLLRQVRARADLARTYLSMRRLYDRAGQIAWAVDCHFRATTIFDELGMSDELRQAQGRAGGNRRGAAVIPNLPLKGPNVATEEAEARAKKQS